MAEITIVSILLITVGIVFITSKMNSHTHSDWAKKKSKRLLFCSAQTAIRRSCSRKEIILLNKQERMLKDAINECRPARKKTTIKHIESVMPIEEEVKIPQQIPVMANAVETNAIDFGEDDSTRDYGSFNPPYDEYEEDDENAFSPSKWWDDNYTELRQISEDKCILSKDILPEENLWPVIGIYVLNEEEFSDYAITEDGLIFR